MLGVLVLTGFPDSAPKTPGPEQAERGWEEAAARGEEPSPRFQATSPAAGAVPCWHPLGKPYAPLPAVSHHHYRQQNPAVAPLSNLFLRSCDDHFLCFAAFIAAALLSPFL